MKIPLMDMSAQYQSIRAEIDQAMQQAIEGGQLILGPNVSAIEKEIAHYLGVSHAVGVASGTDALVLGLRAVSIQPGDEVILPTYTFFATVEAVMQVGATPVFVDSQPDTYCLNVDQVEARLTERTKAVMAVHLYGCPAEMDSLRELTQSRGIKIIEDNAQAMGADYHGMKTGSIGDVGCLSFFPSKNLGAYGDGGMVVTNDAGVAQRVRMLRTHGWQKKYFPEMVGYNSRLDEIQAAILRVKLQYLDAWNAKRRELAHEFTARLQKLGIGVPCEPPQSNHVYHLYIIAVENRETVQAALKEAGIASGIYYPQPLHEAEPCRALGYSKGSFPIAEEACRKTLAIPLFPEMSQAQVDEVLTVLERIIVSGRSR